MLIKEVLGYLLPEENVIDNEMQQSVHDMILRARKGNIRSLGLKDIARELSKLSDGVYLNPTDPELKQALMDILQQNDWVKHVDPSGTVVLKKPGGDPMDPGAEPGDEMEKQEREQEKKAQRIASKNVKDKAKGKDDLL